MSLCKPITLSHIDFRFAMYQQSTNPMSIQVTLLRQHSTGFGCRSKPAKGAAPPTKKKPTKAKPTSTAAENAASDAAEQPTKSDDDPMDGNVDWQEANGENTSCCL